MGKSGVITEKNKENKAYHNVIILFKNLPFSFLAYAGADRAGEAPLSERVWDGCGQLSGIYLSGRNGLE